MRSLQDCHVLEYALGQLQGQAGPTVLGFEEKEEALLRDPPSVLRRPFPTTYRLHHSIHSTLTKTGEQTSVSILHRTGSDNGADEGVRGAYSSRESIRGSSAPMWWTRYSRCGDGWLVLSELGGGFSSCLYFYHTVHFVHFDLSDLLCSCSRSE